MNHQDKGTIRIVKSAQGHYRIVIKGMDGRQYNVMTGVGDLGAAIQVAENKAAFNGFTFLTFHEEKVIYWCREGMLGQHRIMAHDVVEAREAAAKMYLDPRDVATMPDVSLPTF